MNTPETTMGRMTPDAPANANKESQILSHMRIGKEATVSNGVMTREVDEVTLLVELIAEQKNGYIIRVPSLPGCAAQGESEAEAIEALKDVFRAIIESYGGIESVKFEDNPTLNGLASRRYISVELGRKAATSAKGI